MGGHSNSSSQKDYHASFAGLIGHGPLDFLSALYYNDERIWPSEGDEGLERGAEDSVTFTIEGRGDATLYWGTETQDVDPLLASSGQAHPAYRGQAYIVFEQFYLGQSTQSVGNIEVVAGRYPEIDWLTSPSNQNDDCNPVALLADLWQNPRAGLGLDESRLDTDALNEIAALFAAGCISVSPKIVRTQSLRQILGELCDYFDGFLRRTRGGLLTLDFARETLAAEDIPTFDESDLLAPPKWNPGNWQETFNLVNCNFTNRDNDFQTEPATGESGANRQITGSPKVKTLDRPWITRQRYAAVLAVVTASRLGLPEGKGTLLLRRSRAADLRAGDVFRWSHGHYSLCNLLCRATEVSRRSPARPEIEVSFTVDRGILNALFAEPALVDPPAELELALEKIEDQAAMEMPFIMEGGSRNTRSERLLFLAARPNSVTSNWILNRSNGGTYTPERIRGWPGAGPNGYVFHGTLHADYPVTDLVDADLGMVINLDNADTDLSASGLADQTLAHAVTNEWMVWINDGAAGAGPTEEAVATSYGELLSVYAAELLASGRYRLKAIRGRFDTGRVAHTAGAECWLFRPVTAYPNDWDFRVLAMSSNFKLQPVVLGERLDLDLADALPVTRTTRCLAPLGPANLKGNGELRPSLSGGMDLVLTWDNVSDLRTTPFYNYNFDLPQTILKVGSGATGAYVLSILKAAGAVTHTIAAADLLAALGSLVDFRVVALHSRDSVLSIQNSRCDVVIL